MQPPILFSARRFFTGVGVSGLLLGLMIGCRPPRQAETPRPQPFVGVMVRLACDPLLEKTLLGRGRIWGTRTGGTVVAEADWTRADVGIVPPTRLGELAVGSGGLATRPGTLADREHPLKWSDVLPAYQDKLCNWGRRPVALPILGDGYVLVYRADRFADKPTADAFREKYRRDLIPPRSWEELRTVAEFFHGRDGRSSLPPFPTDTSAAATVLNQIAACYDHSAAVDASGTAANPDTAFRFHVDPETTTPRLTAPPFVTALGWLHNTAKFRAPNGDAVASFTTNAAVIGVASLAEVERLRQAADANPALQSAFGFAPMPGAAVWYQDGQPQPVPDGRNYVPYLGAGGRLGVVFKNSAVPEAAWDFLAELASPGGADDTLALTPLGPGPTRYSQVSQANKDQKWAVYGFDGPRTTQLATAVAAFAEPRIREPVYPLRTPDQAARTSILADAARKAATGALPGDQAAAEAQAAWLALDAKTPLPTRRAWVRNAVGLE